MTAFPRFRLKDLSELCRRMGIGLEAGIDTRKLWKRESERSHRHRAALEHVSTEINRGNSLVDAIEGTGDSFPPLMHDLIRVGEQTGKLDHIMLRMADHFDHMLTLRRLFLTGITWPAIQLVMAFGVIGMFIFFLGMAEPTDEFPIHTLVFGLRGVSGLIKYVLIVGSICIGGWVLITNWSRGKMGAEFILPLIYRIPQLGGCLRTMALGRMAWTLSLTTDTPMDVMESMRSSLKSTGTPIYSDLRKPVIAELKSGAPIHQALRSTDAFPSDFLDAIEVGEQSGRLSESLFRLSERYEQQAKSAAKILTVIGSFAVWAMAGSLIVYFILKFAIMYTNFITGLADGKF